MSESDVFGAVTDLIEQVTQVPAARITQETRFESLEGWTSFASLQVLTGIEDRLGVRLDLRDYLAGKTVDDLVRMVSVRLAGQSA